MRRRPAGVAVLVLGLAGCASGMRGAAPAARPEALATRLQGMIWPLPVRQAGEVTSEYGQRSRRHHAGLDIDGRTGDPIHAAREGRVAFSGWRNGYGQTVILDHGEGVTTLYAHASQLWVKAGQQVQRGEVIASVGATGNARGDHLHFEVAWAGFAFDPTPLLPGFRPR